MKNSTDTNLNSSLPLMGSRKCMSSSSGSNFVFVEISEDKLRLQAEVHNAKFKN